MQQSSSTLTRQCLFRSRWKQRPTSLKWNLYNRTPSPWSSWTCVLLVRVWVRVGPDFPLQNRVFSRIQKLTLMPYWTSTSVFRMSLGTRFRKPPQLTSSTLQTGGDCPLNPLTTTVQLLRQSLKQIKGEEKGFPELHPVDTLANTLWHF